MINAESKLLWQYLKVRIVFEKVVEHRLGPDALPVENVVQRFTVRDVDGDHGEVCERRDACLKGLKVESRLDDDYRWSPLLVLVSREEFVQGFVNLFQVNFNAHLEGVF